MVCPKIDKVAFPIAKRTKACLPSDDLSVSMSGATLGSAQENDTGALMVTFSNRPRGVAMETGFHSLVEVLTCITSIETIQFRPKESLPRS
jgi:hypothetical protein